MIPMIEVTKRGGFRVIDAETGSELSSDQVGMVFSGPGGAGSAGFHPEDDLSEIARYLRAGLRLGGNIRVFKGEKNPPPPTRINLEEDRWFSINNEDRSYRDTELAEFVSTTTESNDIVVVMTKEAQEQENAKWD